jgi:hypothetical protein
MLNPYEYMRSMRHRPKDPKLRVEGKVDLIKDVLLIALFSRMQV